MRTAVDLINLSLSAPLDGDIPDRVWSGKDISYKHLRVFGCRAFVHIPKDKTYKLDDKTKPCTFLGYGHEEFGYRLWDSVNRKVIRSSDVVFLEKQTSDDTKQREGRESSQEVPDDLDPVPSHTTWDHGRDVQDEQNDTTDNEPVDDQVLPIQTDDPVPPSEATVRRSTRQTRPSTRYNPDKYMMLCDGGEQESYPEAISHDQKDMWMEDMKE